MPRNKATALQRPKFQQAIFATHGEGARSCSSRPINLMQSITRRATFNSLHARTEVVARRVANLLKTGKATGLTPAGIVAFTFTDKAAAELKERIVTRCREELGDIVGMAEMYVGTIHGYCLDLLKSEVPEYLKYGVLNEVQQTLLVDRSSRASGLTASTDLNGAALHRFTDTSRYVAALGILREARLNDKKLKGVSVVDGLKLYQALLAEKRYLDYSAIMVEAVRAIAQDKPLQKRLAARIKHVIVDEYQDVNPIQECIVKLLHDLGAHICIVGDDDQTIYQWRGSDITNITSFAARYPKVQKVRLQENFRSSKGVVETARDFISQNTKRLAKAMIPTNAQPFETGDIVALALDDPKAEAEFIAGTVKQLRGIAFQDGDRTRGLSYSDCAILLRSVKANADPIVSALKTAGIPAIIIGMNHLFETPEASRPPIFATNGSANCARNSRSRPCSFNRRKWRTLNVSARVRMFRFTGTIPISSRASTL
jgi:DNA helicase II / ATP-dependent DNA helicase PcrA